MKRTFSEEKIKNLREEAERALKKLGNSNDLSDGLEDNFKKILHELQVHQLELEMQNEELTRVQNLLELERNQFEELFEYAPVGYLVMNKNGKINNANQTFCNLIKSPKKQVVDRNFKEFIAFDDQDVFYLHIQNILEKDSKQVSVLRIINHTNDIIWIHLESSIIYSKGKTEYIIQSSISDITESKKNEEQMLRLSKAFEQSANSIIITDTYGRIEYANPVFYEKTGFSPAETIGKNPRIIKHENSVIDYKSMWETITSGKTWKGEFLNKTKHGRLFWEIATITPVKNKEGEIINFLAIKEDITKRKKAEEKLQKAKDFYLNLLEDFPVMVWQSNAEGQFNFVNKTFLYFTGQKSKTNALKTYKSLIHPKDLGVFEDAFQKSLGNKTSFVVEYRIRDRYDNYRWILNHARPFSDLEGNYGGFIATCIDIHDRHTIEQRLIENEDKYRRMFEDSSLGIFKLDRNFTFVNANNAFAEMFGYDNSVDFLIEINNSPERFFPDFGLEKDFRKQLVRSKENRFVVEKELTRKDGSTIHTVIHLRKVYERSRKKEFYMEGFIEDVTNRKNSELKLSYSEQKFKTLFEKSYDAIVIIDKHKIIDFNKKAIDLFNLDNKDLSGIDYSDLSPEKQYDGSESQKLFKKRVNKALAGEPQTFEWLHIRDGKTFDAEISLARIFVKSKYMVQAIIRDITEKKIVEKQLKQARDDAEKARMAQSDFLSLMSHEIRTPLNAVVSLTDLMLHETHSPDQEENLDTIKLSAAHLLRLIDDILDYNKIESGNIQFEKESFNIRQLAEQLKKALEIKAKERGNILYVEVDHHVPLILVADTLRLQQILINLLSNAIKFTQNGYISLRISKSENNNNVTFEIKDTGIGISEERLEAIFDKFTQEHINTSRKFGGSGLGLTVCKKLVEMQGGNIFASSKQGEESVFTFYLPLEEGVMVSETHSEEKISRPDYSLDNMEILLVEDDKMNQFVGRKVIDKKWKARLTIVATGEEALEMLAEKHFDLVLMDLLLPQMNGYEVAEKVRMGKNVFKDPDVPIIALTADAFVETRQKAIESGMNDFISKPFDYDNLFNKINKYKPSG